MSHTNAEKTRGAAARLRLGTSASGLNGQAYTGGSEQPMNTGKGVRMPQLEPGRMTGSTVRDPRYLPLRGQFLIEASAGTGKSFTLVFLYLRLLLGLETPSRAALKPNEILVLTFTLAATEELRARIQAGITALLQGLYAPEKPQSQAYVQDLLRLIANRPLAIAQLTQALASLEEAAIYTLHGFCHQVLSQFPFEMGYPPPIQTLQEGASLRWEALLDVWRRTSELQGGLPWAEVLSFYYPSPTALRNAIDVLLQHDTVTIRQWLDEEAFLRRYTDYRAQLARIRSGWLEQEPGWLEQLQLSAKNPRVYTRSRLQKWAQQVTGWARAEGGHALYSPKVLSRFQASFFELGKAVPDAGNSRSMSALLLAIEQVVLNPLKLKPTVLHHMLAQVRRQLTQEQSRGERLSFDELIRRVDEALSHDGHGEILAARLRSRYPVSLVDEFQDTDPKQYRILKAIYRSPSEASEASGLFLVGDPKQAIYGFRGADIFTYLKASADLTAHCRLSANWRSTPAMVAAVNQLFSRVPSPFVLPEIPFYPSEAAAHQASCFLYKAVAQPALRCYTLVTETEAGVGADEYLKAMSACCAQQIAQWLRAGRAGTAHLQHDSVSTPISPVDIAVIVRTGQEASAVQEALLREGIDSVYLSERLSLFKTDEARSLYTVFQGVLDYQDSSSLKASLADPLLALADAELIALCAQGGEWSLIQEEFAQYKSIWQAEGCFAMMRSLLQQRGIVRRLLQSTVGTQQLQRVYRLLAALIPLEAALDPPEALLQQFSARMQQAEDREVEETSLCTADPAAIKLITVYKAKGLEFPIVWVPFPSRFQAEPGDLYHDERSFSLCWSEEPTPQILDRIYAEKLSEEIRLLYVALTRASHHCCVGLAPLTAQRRLGCGTTDAHRSGIGYLLQRGRSGPPALFMASVASLSSSSIHCTSLVPPETERHQKALEPQPFDMPAEACHPAASALPAGDRGDPFTPARYCVGRVSTTVPYSLRSTWRLSSYSGMMRPAVVEGPGLGPVLSAEGSTSFSLRPVQARAATDPDTYGSIHRFPRGPHIGVFLHALLEVWDANAPLPLPVLLAHLTQAGVEREWAPLVKRWMQTLMEHPLDENTLRLQAIPSKEVCKEMEFLFSIEKTLTADHLTELLPMEPEGELWTPLRFNPLQGCLKGFIDLVFRWKGRFYIVDYKSNWLGDSIEAYHADNLAQSVAHHRYDLQYTLYTIALHRHLQRCVPGYQYETHMGGIYYLFLRGFDPCATAAERAKNPGVFYTRLTRETLESLEAQLLKRPSG